MVLQSILTPKGLLLSALLSDDVALLMTVLLVAMWLTAVAFLLAEALKQYNEDVIIGLWVGVRS